MKLTMRLWLAMVLAHGVEAKAKLIEVGFHPAVIIRKAEKSARKGYTDYGVLAEMAWLTDKGAAHIGM